MIIERSTRGMVMTVLLAVLAGGCEPSANSIEPGTVAAPEVVPVSSSPLMSRPAPQFTLKDQRGNDITLGSLRGQWVVLHFYPKEDTPGCTCDATDQTRMLGRLGTLKATVLGVSDFSATNNKYVVEKYNLGFDILSDMDHKAAAAYGAASGTGRGAAMHRLTVIVDPAGVVRYYSSKVVAGEHVDRLSRTLAQLQGSSAAVR
ncbi:MAG: redoxin domain-containing protein [Planctomycetaceae bacterium]|nr:redoxin domain-containing protein [Planctomycetaceae bacterium]